MAKVDQRYQASFTLHPDAGKGGDLVRSIQRTICRWVVNSEERLYNDQGCHLTSKFFEESNIRSLKPRASSVVTDVHYSEDGAAWCMCYRHSDSEVRGVDWITDVGLRLNVDGNVIMSVVLTTSTTGEVLLRKDDDMEWRSTIPMFVRVVLCSKMVKQISVSGLILPMSMELARVARGMKFKNINVNWVRTETEARDVLRIINSPHRRFAVLLVMGESPNAKREALNLGFGLCGKSYVCIIKYDYAVFKQFKEFEIPFDHVKVLLPFHKHDNNDRHPMYRIGESDEQKTDRERVIESQLGYVTSFEEGAVHCLEDITSLNRQEYFRRKNSEFKLVLAKKKVSDQDAADMLAYAESIQKDYEYEKNRAEALQKRCDDYTIEIEGIKDEAQQKLLSLEQKYNGQLRRRKESAQLPCAFPNKVKDLKGWSKLLCNLKIDEHAWQGMEDRDNVEAIGEAWTMLWHLNFTMCKIRFEESGHDDIRTVFKDRSGYTYTADENADVKKKWTEGHKAIVDGREFMCWRHIKRGNDNMKLMRIYFEFDLDQHCIVISWIGSHLKTNLTKCQ